MAVVNSTVTAYTKPLIRINLQNLPNAQTFPKFPAAKVKFPGYTAMIFASGKINVLGSRNPDIDEMKTAIEEYLQNAGYNTTVSCTVKNIVVSGTLKKHVNLVQLYTCLKSCSIYCIYEPETYPAIRIWHECSVLVYHTGKIIVTGTKCKQTAQAKFMWIEDLAQHVYSTGSLALP